jgi:hypothetical protein
MLIILSKILSLKLKYLIGHGLNIYINTPMNADVIEHEIQWKLQTIKRRRLERHQHD